jgi:hypothetical protein
MPLSSVDTAITLAPAKSLNLLIIGISTNGLLLHHPYKSKGRASSVETTDILLISFNISLLLKI